MHIKNYSIYSLYSILVRVIELVFYIYMCIYVCMYYMYVYLESVFKVHIKTTVYIIHIVSWLEL